MSRPLNLNTIVEEKRRSVEASVFGLNGRCTHPRPTPRAHVQATRRDATVRRRKERNRGPGRTAHRWTQHVTSRRVTSHHITASIVHQSDSASFSRRVSNITWLFSPQLQSFGVGTGESDCASRVLNTHTAQLVVGACVYAAKLTLKRLGAARVSFSPKGTKGAATPP